MDTLDCVKSFVVGIGVGLIVAIALLETFDGGRYGYEGYAQGVKDCMAGEANAIITTDTIVAYPSR